MKSSDRRVSFGRRSRVAGCAVGLALTAAACGDSVVETDETVPIATGAAPDSSGGVSPAATGPTTTAGSSVPIVSGSTTSTPDSAAGSVVTTESLPPPDTLPAPLLLDVSSLTATVSSQLPDSTVGDTYGPENLLDADPSTAWNHCGSECTDFSSNSARNGVGQVIILTLDQPLAVVGLSIMNGYQKPDDETFFRNNRIARATIRFGDGSTEAITLADERGVQEIGFNLRSVASVALHVDDVYLGDGTFNDLAVSEIGLWVVDSDEMTVEG